MDKKLISVKIVDTNEVDADTLNNIVDIMKKPYFEDTPYGNIFSSDVELDREVISDIEDIDIALRYLVDTRYLNHSEDEDVTFPCTTCNTADEVQALNDRINDNNETYFEALENVDYIDYSQDEGYIDIELAYDGVNRYRLYL